MENKEIISLKEQLEDKKTSKKHWTWDKAINMSIQKLEKSVIEVKKQFLCQEPSTCSWERPCEECQWKFDFLDIYLWEKGK